MSKNCGLFEHQNNFFIQAGNVSGVWLRLDKLSSTVLAWTSLLALRTSLVLDTTAMAVSVGLQSFLDFHVNLID